MKEKAIARLGKEIKVRVLNEQSSPESHPKLKRAKEMLLIEQSRFVGWGRAFILVVLRVARVHNVYC